MRQFERDTGGRAKILIGAAIVAAHALALSVVVRPRTDRSGRTQPVAFVSTAQFIVQSSAWDRTPIPEVTLDTPRVESSSLEVVQFDTSVEEELAGVIAPASAPRLSRFQVADVTAYARRAQVAAGHPRTVVLAVEVGEDGAATSVEVARSCGDATADAAAVDYALELRWVPATRDRGAISVRVLLPVTLSIPL